jgi:hypothetical protein
LQAPRRLRQQSGSVDRFDVQFPASC